LKKKIWITGHNGMLGSSLVKILNLIGLNIITVNRNELNLLNQEKVVKWMKKNKPDIVIHAAAKVGGIYANKIKPADFLHENLILETSVIHASHLIDIEKLIFIASNCVYPVGAEQPIHEDCLLNGSLEENIKYYAIAKISGIQLCRAYNQQYGHRFISVIPPNLYGPGDNYHPKFSHVIAGLLRRAHEAKIKKSKRFTIWGGGNQRREFLFVDDLSAAIKSILFKENKFDLYNVGSNKDYSINEIATVILKTIDFNANILSDMTKPEGSKSKLLDSSRMLNDFNWKPSVSLEQGLKLTYFDFLKKYQ
jgi:GDP-L-fucose synthase